MHRFITISARRAATILVAIGIGLVACSPAPGASTGSNGGSSAAAESQGSVSGEATVEGSLVSSGLYAATWTWETGNAAGPGIGGITVTSDKGTFGSIQVLADGSITFTSGAPELSANGTYTGSGAQVTLKDQVIPCGFKLDNDVTGTTDGGVLHLKGTMTIHGGSFAC
jgi:hypothetical protein